MEKIFFAILACSTLSNTMLSAPSTQAVPASPKTNTSHVTTTSGNGTNHVYNVSFVNNNAHQPTPTPQPQPQVPQTSYQAAQEYLKKTFDPVHLSDIASAIYQYCYENKYYIAASALCGGYLYMFYKLRTIQSYVDNQPSWGAWKRNVPMDTFLAIPQDKLTHDLMMTIQERYISIENPTDSLTPLIAFSKDIAEEKELVNAYHTYVLRCTQCSLNKILPFSETLLAQLTERKHRITYLSTLFQSWLAHYKLEQIKHARTILEVPRVDAKS